MNRYRVVYSRGSFSLVTLCDTRGQALAKADALHRTVGVWHVHVEDVDGNRIAGACDLLLGRPDAPHLHCARLARPPGSGGVIL